MFKKRFAWTSPCFPLTRVRKPTELVQRNLFRWTFSWRAFRPRKKIFTPPPNSLRTPSRRRDPAPLHTPPLLGEHHASWDFKKKNRAPPPSLSPWTPLSETSSKFSFGWIWERGFSSSEHGVKPFSSSEHGVKPAKRARLQVLGDVCSWSWALAHSTVSACDLPPTSLSEEPMLAMLLAPICFASTRNAFIWRYLSTRSSGWPWMLLGLSGPSQQT